MSILPYISNAQPPHAAAHSGNSLPDYVLQLTAGITRPVANTTRNVNLPPPLYPER